MTLVHGPGLPLPFRLPSAIQLTLPPTILNHVQVVSNNGAHVISNNGGNIISDGGGQITGSYQLLAGTTNALGLTLPYLQLYFNSTDFVNAALAALQAYSIGDVVSDGTYTYTMTQSGSDIVLAAYEGNQVDPARETLAADFSSSSKGYLVFHPSTIDPVGGKMLARADFDLDAGDLDDYIYTDASVVHPNGPGVRALTRIRFVAPPHPAPGDMIFKMAPSLLQQDLTTGQWAAGQYASNFPPQGGAAFLFVPPLSVALPPITYYMDSNAVDVDASVAPAALKAVTPTASDFYKPYTAVAPASPPENDPAFQFPH